MLDPQDLDRVQDYLAGELSSADETEFEARLQREPELAEALLLAAREEAIYADWARVAGQTPQLVGPATIPVVPAPRTTLPARGVIATAIFSVAAVLMLWFRGPAPNSQNEILAQLSGVSGEVYLLDGITRRRVWHIGSLRIGQGLELVGDEATADVVYPDGTRLEFDGDAKVQEFTGGSQASKRIVLTSGNVRADVAKQPAGLPMILKTANSEVVVLGTKFDLAGSDKATYVETSEGAVRLSRDGRSIEVPAGFESTADGGDQLNVQPSPPRYRNSRKTAYGNHRTTLLSPDGRTLVASMYESMTIELYDVPSGKARESFGPGKPIEVAAVSADGRRLAAGGAGKVYVLDFTTIRKLHTFDVPDRLLALSFSADGAALRVLSGIPQKDIQLQVWDCVDGAPLGVPQHLQGEAWAFSASGRSLAVSSARDHTITVWDLAARRKRMEFPKVKFRTLCFGISPDDKQLAISSMDGRVTLYDIDSAREERVFLPPGGSVQSLTFSPDGTMLAMGQRFAMVRMWSLATGKQLYMLEGDRRPGATASVRAIAFTPDLKTLATAESQDDSMVRLWDLPAN